MIYPACATAYASARANADATARVSANVRAFAYAVAFAVANAFALALANAADVRVNPDAGGKVTVRVGDGLAVGDLEKLLNTMQKAWEDGYLVVAVELVSDGGDGDTGLALAEYVHDQKINVLLSGRCYSACAFPAMVALGQGTLTIRVGADLGVHQAKDTLSGEDDPWWTELAARRLRNLGAPEQMLADMLATPPNGLKRYSYDELVAMGAMVE